MKPEGAEQLLAKLPEKLLEQLSSLARDREAAVQDEASYDAALNRARERASELQEELEPVLLSEHAIRELLRLDTAERETAVLEDESFHNPVAVLRLLAASDSFRGEDALEAENLASLALRLTEEVGAAWPESLRADLRTSGYGHQGNALRIFANLPAADAALGRARECFEHGSGDVLLAAQLDVWEGCLRRDQRRFPEAIALQKRCCKRLRGIGDLRRLATYMISLAYTYRASGEHETGLVTLREVEGMLSAGDPLWWYVRHNQIVSLIDLGRVREAEELFRGTRPMYQVAPGSLDQLRVQGMEGRLALANGRLDEAEALLQGVRREFLDRGMAYDAALVALETAEVFVRQDRHGELKALAADMISVFQSHDIERETYAAMILFQRAAQAERATLELIHRIWTQLRRRNPVHAELDSEPY